MPDESTEPKATRAAVRPHVTLARRVADRIRAEMIRHCRPGDRLPAERALAEQLGVSRRTVRKALADLAGEGWLRARPGHGHLVTHPPDRLPGTTALLLPVAAANMLSAPFFREVFLGLSQAMQQAGRHMLSLFGSGRYLMQPDASGAWEPKLRQVDSLISFEVFNERVIEQASRLYPVVALDMRLELANVSSIAFDDVASVRIAFKHLADLGHRRIGFVGRTGGHADPAVETRIRAYREAFGWLGMRGDARWIYPADAQTDLRALARRWMRLPSADRPTALIMADLFWSLTPIWLNEGVKVPDDLSLVNIDVVNVWSDHVYHAWHCTRSGPWEAVPRRDLWPPFTNHPAQLALLRPTTVELPAQQMGVQAVGEVVRRLGDSKAKARQVVLEPSFVHGNTSAAPP